MNNVDLQTMCAEILEWQKTGVLTGDSLRNYANRMWPYHINQLQLAEKDVATAVMKVIVKCGVPNWTDGPVAKTCAEHTTGEIGYCKFLTDVPYDTLLYTRK